MPIQTIDANDVTSIYPRERFIYPRCVPINPLDSEEDIIVDQEQYNEQAAQMHEHGFDNLLNNNGTTKMIMTMITNIVVILKW